MAKDVQTLPGPYRPVKFEDFTRELSWPAECGAFVLIGVGVDPDDKKNARLNIANSEISHELMSYICLSFMYHHNLKTDTQEIVLLTKERDAA